MKTFAQFAVLLVVAATTVTAADYCHICKDHTMCLYQWFGANCTKRVHWGVTSSAIKKQIVDLHNQYRSTVAAGKEKRGKPGPQPSASNMMMLAWDDELAQVAQRWADQCNFWHDKCRNVERFGWVGQNLYLSSNWRSDGVKTDDVQDWTRAMAAFYNEVKDLNYKNVDKFGAYPSKNQTGHYTQLVWGETTLVGCGFTSYVQREGEKDWFKKFYVCNYGPGGNVIGAPMYKKGEACSSCSSTAPNCAQQSLCAPRLTAAGLVSALAGLVTRVFG
ncbi:venom allergen 5-like [Periplaneta americana]|uniref:venom allergen 5-like n=1 Tax=Periplaneta americana TaxID=6978 RepID=UPI0037E98B64